MIEKHTINGKDVWLEIQPQPANRPNPNTIPTEYFIARYFFENPVTATGQWLADEDGEPKLFESPVAALSYVSTRIMREENGTFSS